ncbi:MAG: inositol monophosphatase family protein [Planctomycetota bacterium]|jgi:fructose-1,6-bisphosphatase/inositol monophosphatase family enzyme
MSLTPLELDCIRRFRSGTAPPAAEAGAPLVLRLLLEAARRLRRTRLAPGDRRLKDDGSPSVEIERQVEAEIRAIVAKALPDAAFVGEEFGGTFSQSGVVVAVDPVDGTWAFLNGTETFATSVTVFRDGKAVCCGVGNPATGELAYTAPEGATRLVQLSAFGEPDAAVTLPTARSPTLLLNIHPSQSAGPLLQAAQSAWTAGSVRMVRAPGGSPAWALLEAAKGHFVYINLWARRSAEPFDLAGPMLLVRGAGGEVTDADGRPVGETGHLGPLIAAVDPDAAEAARALVRAAAARS